MTGKRQEGASILTWVLMTECVHFVKVSSPTLVLCTRLCVFISQYQFYAHEYPIQKYQSGLVGSCCQSLSAPLRL